ncbi:molybdate ABC transporter substrate-binding protein [Petroclostridium sp. X23]|uniref:molybdate ABC transporter substrate-binding protein n=1 Tax=Petroclostridium sp. X23 TaxID=3045146 RepID=UPI0024AD14E8|nr:molybdate ABC transporter substrate-binding protein [Petroclostridium sp. X23]WHH58732.1 molybdate ABC transporter substrate-binding protein [Petroclostridium sp. X23]
MYNKIKSSILMLMVPLFVSLLFLGGCSSEVVQEQQQEEPKTLFAYVGANLKNPVSDLAASYEEKTGVKVELTFNNSGMLMNQLETMKKGDIYMPGGMPFVEQAKQKGHIDQVVGPIAYHTPVIITPKDNPAQVSSLDDLSKEGVKLVIPDKDATAIGKTAYKIFNKTGKTAEIEKNIIANLETPPKVLAAITMGQGNAGIVEYSNTFKDKEKIEVIEIDPKVNEVEQIPIASLVYSADKELAADFMKYVQENGPVAFEKYGFKTK